ncbi:MAG TPA: penicillin-binding protein 1C [Cellvibrio sp.]|nr:penicillin-binding protein 1C [Cellvibrio sp.]
MATGGLSVLLVILQWAPLPAALSQPQCSRALFDRDGRLLDVQIATDQQWRLPLGNDPLPEKYVLSLQSFEDRYYRYHPGINPLAIMRAAAANWRAGRVQSGASTITMQVARLALDNPPRTYINKLREMALALQLEWRYSKDEILRHYATLAPFGGNVVGLHAASWRYFGRAPQNLSWAEAALLAVLPNSPALLHPGRHRDLLTAKRNRLLGRLHQQGTIDDRDFQLALLEPLPSAPEPWPNVAPHLLQRLITEQPQQALFHTTVDANLQRSVHELIAQQSPALATEGVRNIAAVVIDHESLQVLAYIGNYTDDRSSGADVDIAASPRSTGSILKPLLYGLMLQDGELLPSTLVADVPTNFGGYSPENVDLDYRGAVPANEVLAQSLNVPSVRMLKRYGVEHFRERLQAFGLNSVTRSAEDYGLSLILGGAEASLWELSAAYANLTHTASHPNAEPLRRNMVLLKNYNPDSTATPFPLHSGAAWLTLQAMTNVVRPGGDMFWRDYENSQVIAWKTGTSFGLRDGWAIGSNGHYTVGVWTGNADGSAAATLGGARSAGPILMQIFAHLGNAPWLVKPATALKTVSVCADDGYLASNDCKTLDISAPAEAHFEKTSPYHQRVFLSADGRRRVHSGCEKPSNMRAENWYLLPPGMEYFWKQHHSEYRSLPPWRDDCIATLQQYTGDRPFDIIYPDAYSQFFIPLEMDGRQGRIVFRAAHRSAQAILYWHLDGNYLGETRLFHEKSIVANPGPHTLVLVDQNGQRLERKFNIGNPEQ